jgi:hypothetical protein
MMKVGIAVRLGFAIAGLLIAGSALAQGPGDGPGTGPGFGEHRPPFEKAFGGQGIHGRWWNNPRIVERLKLTDEQRKSFDDILFQHRETLIDLRGSLAKAELELEPLIRNDQPNESSGSRCRSSAPIAGRNIVGRNAAAGDRADRTTGRCLLHSRDRQRHLRRAGLHRVRDRRA